ncbi:MAG TPA: EF-P lysine aminoacylase EpmA [Roseiarcus sp.]|nr:EF-P lysine aminoacylase EpmA [Roseiarcus sp.]
MPATPPFWRRDRHAKRRDGLLKRTRIADFVRRWFDANGFVEVDTAALQASPGNETHLHGFRTALVRPDGSASEAYLHTSPEFAMKKLLAAGETRIFSLSHVFRNRERTALRAPEFTMLEWYRVGAPLERLMDDCAALLALAAHLAGAKAFVFRGREASPFEPPERLTVREAFQRHAGIDLYESLPLGKDPDTAFLSRQAVQAGTRIAADDTWSDIFSRLLSERVEPRLGATRATILYGYPASEAALAQVSADDQRIAERFEIYCCGVELANAFHELLDADEQRRRFEADMAEQECIYGTSYPIDEDFLDALSQMPDVCGAALGFDRLVMLATGAERIDDVQWTPVFETETPA